MYIYNTINIMSDISKDLVAATSIPLILSILTENETYGYELSKF